MGENGSSIGESQDKEARIQERIAQLPESIRSALSRMKPESRRLLVFSDESLLNNDLSEIEAKCKKWGLGQTDSEPLASTQGERAETRASNQGLNQETLRREKSAPTKDINSIFIEMGALIKQKEGLVEKQVALMEVKREMEKLKQRYEQNRGNQQQIIKMPEGKAKLTAIVENSRELEEICLKLLELSKKIATILNVKEPNLSDLKTNIERSSRERIKGEELLTIADLNEGGFIDEEETERLTNQLNIEKRDPNKE